MGERKTVSRNVVVALGVVCTILVVLLSGSILLYTENISTLNFEKKVLQGNVNDLTVEKTNLQIQVNDLNNIVNLNRSKIWVFNQTIIFPAGSWAGFTRQDTEYAGYVTFTFQTPMNDTTYVQATYFSHDGTKYDYQVRINTNGATSLPVLPTLELLIKISDQLNAVDVIMTAIYTY